jgi:hypothetical protein
LKEAILAQLPSILEIAAIGSSLRATSPKILERRLMTYSPALQFEVVSSKGRSTLEAEIKVLVIAGWTGRDAEAMEKHIRELEKLGVARPASMPVFYRVSASRLTQSNWIEVPGRDSSGEAEFVVLLHKGESFIGVGSDHTDRKVETYGITVSKQMCDKPVAPTLWPFADVQPHWDKLILRSWIDENGSRVLYQEGSISTMLDPETLLELYRKENEPLSDGGMMFCGTLSALGGVRYSPGFAFELCDPVLERTITHSYRVQNLPVLG